MATDRVQLFCEILLAIILPPLGVCFRFGCCTCEFLICLLLTLLGYLPGILYAVYVIVIKGRHHDQAVAEPQGYYTPVSQ